MHGAAGGEKGEQRFGAECAGAPAYAPRVDIGQRIASIDQFWTRQYAWYLNEHRHPGNRASHMIGIPVLLVTGVWGLATLDWRMFLGGQLLGWAIQLAGHRIEGNRPALLENKIAFLMGPLMVLVEMTELVGLHFDFADRARRVVFGAPG
jgi:uncharacterized membrane protein YGL010W